MYGITNEFGDYLRVQSGEMKRNPDMDRWATSYNFPRNPQICRRLEMALCVAFHQNSLTENNLFLKELVLNFGDSICRAVWGGCLS